MEGMLYVLGMFLLRLGLPLALTLAVGYWLHRMDARWQAEALAQRAGGAEQGVAGAELKALKPAQPCWEVKGCDESRRAQCPACKLLDIPCWVARLRVTGRLPEECFGCQLFSLKPAHSLAI